MSSWEDLPLDLLTTIVELLPSIADSIRFGAVCKSWASSLSPPLSSLSLQKIPYLFHAGPCLHGEESSDSCTLLSPSCDRFFHIPNLPELRGKWFIGSQDGWLATLDELSNPALFNPFTRAHILLPPYSSIETVKPVTDPLESTQTRYTLRCPDAQCIKPLAPVRHDEENFRVLNPVFKVVLSSSPSKGSFVAIAIFSERRMMLVARAGECKWNLLVRHEDFHDVIYYKHSRMFLAVDRAGNLKTISVRGNSVRVRLLFGGGFVGPPNFRYRHRYLVECSGSVLQVCRETDFVNFDRHSDMYRLSKIVIMKLVTDLSVDAAMWVPMTNLGDYSLFLGGGYSMSLLVLNMPGLRCNCIYFTDNNWDDYYEVRYMARDAGIVSLEDRSLQIYYPLDSHPRWPPSIWIIPTV